MPLTALIKSMTRMTVVAVFAGCLALAGCTQPLDAQSSSQAEEAPTSRSFMANVNEASAELSDRMSAFTDAVSREDLVSMQTQADAAFAIIDQISQLECPEELNDLKQRYVDGCTQLKDSLNAYLQLYLEMDTASAREPFDYGSYADRIAQVQQTYDDAVQTLQDADSAATEM